MVPLFAALLAFAMTPKRILSAGADFIFFLTYFYFSGIAEVMGSNPVQALLHKLRT